MWPFTTHVSLAQSGLLRGLTDCHSHLLPGVDDGVQTLAESLDILSLMEQQGVRKLWLTPHIMEDYPNRPADLRLKFAELQASYAGPIELHLAAEHMLDYLFEERLEADDLLPLEEGKRFLLVETSYFNPPMDLENMLQRIQAKNYYPLLAHPERYAYMDKKYYRKLWSLDIDFQLNLSSLMGGYGKEVQQKAQWLLKQGWYAVCGSDTHRRRFWTDGVHEGRVENNCLKADLFGRNKDNSCQPVR